MLHRLWLLFAQICTVALALLFVVATLRPEWVNVPLLTGKRPAPVTQQPVAALPPVVAPPQTTTAPVKAVATYSDAVKRALPAVVSIQTARVGTRNTDPFFEYYFGRNRGQVQQRQVLGEGSGAIVSAAGHVLTNNHVIQGATEIVVMLVDGRTMKAKVLGADPESDLAVLKVDEQNLPVIPLGNSEALQVGDVVLAMGNPFGISNTVTMGIVSALSRKRVSESNPFEDFIQTDAAINPGNSGGPLVNTAGELVGINTAIYSRTGSTAGIGFSIPAALVRSTMEQIIATGTVTRGYLGVSMQELNARLIKDYELPNETKGALIAAVVADGPAARAGVRAEDIITEINGKKVADQDEAIATIASLKPDSQVPVKVLRNGKPMEVNVTLGKRPPRAPQRE